MYKLRRTLELLIASSEVRTVGSVQVQGSAVAALPRRDQVQDEGHTTSLQLIIMTEQDI